MALPPADDLTWLALVIWDEAQGEPFVGQAAVGAVVDHRRRLLYEQIAKDAAGAEAQAGVLLAQAMGSRAWPMCKAIAAQIMAGTYQSTDPGWLALKACPTAVLYYNPAICRAPAWAIPANLVATIGHHQFFTTHLALQTPQLTVAAIDPIAASKLATGEA